MKPEAMILLFAVLLIAPSFGIEFTSSTRVEGEAQAIDFGVIMEGTSGSLEFEWDFGDGVKAVTEENTASHAYYLDGVGKEKGFTTTVKVKSDGSILAEESINIVVKRSEFKPRLSQPAPVPEYAEEKGSIHPVSLLFLDAYGQEVPSNRVIEARAEIKGKEIDLEKSREGVFSGTFNSDSSFHSIEKLEIEAEIQGLQRKNFTLPVFFKPLEITAENPFTKEYYPGSLIGRVSIPLSLPDGSVPKKGTFTALLFSGGEIAASGELFFLEKEWIADFNHRITAKDLREGLEMVVSGKDSFGNRLREKRFKVLLKEENPLLGIELIKPSPGEGEFGFGQLVEFAAIVSSPEMGSLENVRIEIESSDSRIKRELVREGDHFRAEIRMPEKGHSELLLSLVGSAELEGQTLNSVKEFRASLSREIGIEFIYPSKGITEKKEGGLMELRLSYPNGEGLEVESVRAVLQIDGGEPHELLLVRDKKGVYYSETPVELFGEHELVIKLGEPFFGSEAIKTNIVQPVDSMQVFVLALAAVLAVSIAITVLWGIKAKKKEKIRLKARLGEIEKQLKSIGIDYYRKKLDDSKYRERVLKLQKEKETILKKIKAGKKGKRKS